MKSPFPKILSLNTLLILVLAMTTSSLMAQFKMIVNSPSNIEGEYDVLLANFGNQSSDFVTGDVVLVDDGSVEGNGGTINDGCQTFIGTTGKVAFIDRGACNFTEKCFNAENDGAIAVVVCNSISDEIISMTGETEISIPCYMASLEDCDALKVEIANGLNVSLGFPCDLSGVSYPDNVIFGDEPGEGDFDGGLNDWAVDENGWIWDGRGGSKGAYSSHFVGQTPTYCNGAMVFDSDYLDNDGSQSYGVGQCPAVCTGKLISPVIDLSEVVNGVVLQFSQDIQQYLSDFYILISNDGGLSYYDTIPINTDYKIYDSNYNETIRIPLCDVAGESNFRFSFLIEANYFFWTIDDVLLLDEVFTEGDIDFNWVARYPNYASPTDHVEAIPFMVDIINNGNLPIYDAQLSVKVIGPSGELFTSTLFYDGVIDCGMVETLLFDEMYQVPPIEGMYNVEYVLSSISGAFENDTFASDFKVGGCTFSKTDWQNQEILDWYLYERNLYDWNEFITFANVYRTKEFLTPMRAIGTSFTISSQSQDYSGFANVALYKWVDVNSNNLAESNERFKIAYVFTYYDESQERYDVEFESINGYEDLMLEDNTTYIVAVHLNPYNNKLVFLNSLNTSDFPEINYSATTYAYNTIGESAAQVLMGIGTESSEEDEDARDFNNRIDYTPILPLIAHSMDCYTKIDELNKEINVFIYPNPASDVVGITLDLQEISKNVCIELVSLDGKVVADSNHLNVKNEKLNVNLGNSTNGVYFVKIKTDYGNISKRIIVQK